MQAVGKLEHPHIIRGTDAGEANGMHFLVMEYVGGWDLSRFLRKTGPLQIADACEIVAQAAVGLDAAHQRGFIHRDIKPSNLLLSRLGQVRILDLGLATKNQNGSNWEEQLPRGTADYMAPEQWTGEPAPSSATDIYGLGCTLYALLVGHPPFRGQGIDRREAHLHVGPPSVRMSRPDCPHRLDALVQAMLAKDPPARPSDAGEVVRQLSTWTSQSQLQHLARTWIPADPDVVESQYAPRKPSRKLVSRRTLIAAACTTLLAAGIRSMPTTLRDQPKFRTEMWRPLLNGSTENTPWLTESGTNLREQPIAHLDLQNQSLQIISQGRCAWKLGRPVTTPFRLRARIAATSPNVQSGFFFAGRSEVRAAVPEKANAICHRFHAITISPPAAEGVRVLRWQYIQWTEPSVIETANIAHSLLDTVRNDVNQLELQIGERGEPMVVWNQEPVPWGIWHHEYDAEYHQTLPLHELDRKFSGTIGLVCSGGEVRFSHLELSYEQLR
ncbi:MAG: serine/threonine-protein kinase [Planctomycetota bacterium]|nr:serine/threonine-protein kinase [Planctomycetota bacterium]MDA1179398.1 serine/threonine-protein kinase [Planctomycetota bacterium]